MSSYGDDNTTLNIHPTAIEPMFVADSSLLTNNAQGLCDDVSLKPPPPPPENYSTFTTNILETNRSLASEEIEDESRQLVRTTVPSEEVFGAETKNVEEQAESDLCKVCSDKAGKHRYYGGKSCKSCRQFFRRSVKSYRRQV